MPIALGSITNTRPRLSPIQLLLLVQLEQSPKYGYEMLKAMKKELSSVWVPKTGTIYPALKSLEKHGLVQKQIDHDIDFYHITDEGREVLTWIGRRQEENMMFIAKFFVVIAKWMSPEFKTSFLTSMQHLSRDHTDVYSVIINMLDKQTDEKLKMNILNNIKTILEERLATIDLLIDEQKEKIK
jgi:DNA-binding PadR family transcriptional regulator